MVDNTPQYGAQYGETNYPIAYTRALPDDAADPYQSQSYAPSAQDPRRAARAPQVDESPVPLNVGRFAAGMAATGTVGVGMALLLTFLLNQLYESVGAPWALQSHEYTTGVIGALMLTVVSAAAFLLLAWLVDTPTLIYAWLAGLVAAGGLLVPWLTSGPSRAGFLIGLAYAAVALTVSGLTKALGNKALQNHSFQQFGMN